MRAPQPTPPLPSVSGTACSALGARGTRLRCSGQERAAPTCGAREQRRACSSEADGSQACPAPQRVGGTLLKGPVLAAREEPPPEREPPWSGPPLPDPPWAVEPPRAPGQPQPLAIEVDRARIVSETRLAPDTYDSRSRRAARQAAEIGRLSYANASGPGLGTRMATELCSVRTSLRSVKAKDQGPGPAHWQRARSVYTRRAWSLSLFTD